MEAGTHDQTNDDETLATTSSGRAADCRHFTGGCPGVLEVGFDAATTDMIARRAQTAIGSLYDFFPNKQAIAQRLCEQFCDDLRVLFEGILTDELVQVPLSQLIDDILDPLVQYHQTHPGFQALWLQSQGDPRLVAHPSGSHRGSDQENGLGLRQALPEVGRGFRPAL